MQQELVRLRETNELLSSQLISQQEKPILITTADETYRREGELNVLKEQLAELEEKFRESQSNLGKAEEFIMALQGEMEQQEVVKVSSQVVPDREG